MWNSRGHRIHVESGVKVEPQITQSINSYGLFEMNFKNIYLLLLKQDAFVLGSILQHDFSSESQSI